MVKRNPLVVSLEKRAAKQNQDFQGSQYNGHSGSGWDSSSGSQRPAARSFGVPKLLIAEEEFIGLRSETRKSSTGVMENDGASFLYMVAEGKCLEDRVP